MNAETRVRAQALLAALLLAAACSPAASPQPGPNWRDPRHRWLDHPRAL